MHLRQLIAVPLFIVACTAPTSAQYAPRDPPPPLSAPRPFAQGAINAGGALGLGASGKSFAFTLGLNLGYFVLDGFEPGVYSDVTFGSEIDTQFSVLPYIRYFLFRSWHFSPFLKAQGGGLFFVDGPSLGLIGGGGGFVWGLGGNLGLNIEFVALKLLPESKCPPDDDCMRYNVGISLSYLFGASSNAPRHGTPPRRAPPHRAPTSYSEGPTGPEAPTAVPDEPGAPNEGPEPGPPLH